jgi:hypothetical protein
MRINHVDLAFLDQPAWSVASPIWSGSPASIIAINWEPIIAWFVETTELSASYVGLPTPITIHGDMHGAIKRPDQTIALPLDRTFPSEQVLIDELSEEETEKRAKAERAAIAEREKPKWVEYNVRVEQAPVEEPKFVKIVEKNGADE